MYWKSTGDISQKQTACVYVCECGSVYVCVCVCVCVRTTNPIIFPIDCEFTLSDHSVTRAK